MVNQEVLDLIAKGALFVVNHSGGKDSQAMYHVIRRIVPDTQIMVIHADLGVVEWNGLQEHIKNTIISDAPLIVCRNENKTFLEMVEKRGMFPSPQQRQCTSDLKRGPIEREIRRYLKAHPEFEGRIVNCMGLRAQESSNRAKATIFKKHTGNSIAGREWYDFLPIHAMLIEEVWKTIADAGQKPHPAYGMGMSRLSCRFCIMASNDDLTIAAKLSPELYRTYVDLENKIGRTMMMPRGGVAMTLEQITGVPVQRNGGPQTVFTHSSGSSKSETVTEPVETKADVEPVGDGQWSLDLVLPESVPEPDEAPDFECEEDQDFAPTM